MKDVTMNQFSYATNHAKRFRTALLTCGVLLSAHALAADQAKSSFTDSIPGTLVKFDMIAVPGGKLTLNGKDVEIKPMFVAKTETVWEMFDEFLASGEPSPPYDQTEFKADAIARPSKTYILPDLGWGHNSYPVINVSFTNAQMFCRWLSSVTKKTYRLPTEAEWEWACRGGTTGVWKGDPAQMDAQAWFAANSGKMSHPVGKKSANAFGIHDMFGNAGEWATDMKGEPILCGGTFMDGIEGLFPGMRRKYTPKWQESDPQLPKSRWWFSDGKIVGFRVICEG